MARGPIPDKPRDRPTVPEVLALVRAYYEKPGNSVGGNLHIVLEDGNIEDHSVRFCLDRARVAGDEDGVVLAANLIVMTPTQRRKIAASIHSRI